MNEDHFYELVHKYLKQEMSAEEQFFLEKNLEEDAQRRLLFDTITKSNVKKSSLPELQSKFDKVISSENNTFPTLQKRWLKFPIYKIALAAAVVGAILLFLVPRLQNVAIDDQALAKTIHTKNAERKKITLPDSTEVWLNGGSTISYLPSFGKTDRTIELDGEAFFDVTPNKDLPMIIAAKGIKVKVVGTSFNIKSYRDEDSYEASLVEGKIELYVSDKRKSTTQVYHLVPGEKIKILDNTLSHNQEKLSIPEQREFREYEILRSSFGKENPDETPSEIAWKEEKLAFDSEALSTALLKMEKWYDTKIELQNTALTNLSVTGTFTEKSVEDLLKVLQLGGAQFKYKKIDQRIIIY
ncbi:FecR family protein [Sphingobacterium suaedae]|uniref:FecR family protein n=1 Tax=Sphingobacterium suaedae TaxID=1686402 RepID=A0ABW5KMB9_9SPHI